MKFGIDLGGTKIEVVVLDDENDVLFRERIATEQEGGYRHILSRIHRLLLDAEKAAKTKANHLGICTPGSIDAKTGLLQNSNTVCLNDQPFHHDLETMLGIAVRMENDANCFALAEYTLGSVPIHVPDAKNAFGVIMGTGVGGGVIIDGRLVRGSQGIAGEWGHNYLDSGGGPCYCGNTGCVETNLSGTGIANYYRRLTGEKIKAQEVVQRYRKGESAAEETMERFLELFGKGLAYVVNILDPDAIILGGGAGQIEELHTKGLLSLKKYIFHKDPLVHLLKPKLKDSAGVFGAALL